MLHPKAGMGMGDFALVFFFLEAFLDVNPAFSPPIAFYFLTCLLNSILICYFCGCFGNNDMKLYHTSSSTSAQCLLYPKFKGKVICLLPCHALREQNPAPCCATNVGVVLGEGRSLATYADAKLGHTRISQSQGPAQFQGSTEAHSAAEGEVEWNMVLSQCGVINSLATKNNTTLSCT